MFVGGTREAESVWRGRERSACRGPLTLTQAAHANRLPNTLTLPLTGHPNRLPMCALTLRNDFCFNPFGALGACRGNPDRAWRSAAGPDARREEGEYSTYSTDE